MRNSFKPSGYEALIEYEKWKKDQDDAAAKQRADQIAAGMSGQPAAAAQGMQPQAVVTTTGINAPNPNPGAVSTVQLPSTTGMMGQPSGTMGFAGGGEVVLIDPRTGLPVPPDDPSATAAATYQPDPTDPGRSMNPGMYGRLEDAVPPPQSPGRLPGAEIARAGREGVRRQKAFEESLPLPQDPTPMRTLDQAVPPAPSDGRPPGGQIAQIARNAMRPQPEPPAPTPNTADAIGGSAIAANPVPTPPGPETSSRIGRTLDPLTRNDPILDRIYALNAEYHRIDPGLFGQTTVEQRAQIETRQAQIQQEIAQLQKQRSAAPSGAPANVVVGNVPPPMGKAAATIQPSAPPIGAGTGMPPAGPQAGQATPAPPPAAINTGPMGPPQPPMGAEGPAAMAAAGSPTGLRPPPQAGRGPGGSAGQSQPAPPPAGSAGPGPAAPPGSLWDQRRETAFDPTKDAADPGNIGAVQPGGGVDQQRYAIAQRAKSEFDQAVQGGVHFASWLTHRGETDHPHNGVGSIALHGGVGAMPADVAQNVYQHWSENGRLDPGAAMVRYMVGKYQILSEQGRSAEANQMAFEVLQRLNMEAAMHGGQAVDYMKQGNMPMAVQSIQMGHSMMPDGKQLHISKDGQHGVIVDQFTGQPTSQPFPFTPQWVLGNAIGMQAGTSFWNHLAMRVQQTAKGAGKEDKDAVGRQIRNRNNLLRGKLLERKLAGGGGGGGAPNATMQELQALRFGAPKGGNNITINQGDDTGGADDVGPAEVESADSD